MCDFVLLTLPAHADLTALGERVGNPLEEREIPSLQAELPARTRIVRWRGGRCDCGTPIGSLRLPGSAEARRELRELEQRRKRGWGAAKIDRWLAEKEKVHRREVARVESAGRAPVPALVWWTEALQVVGEGVGRAPVGLIKQVFSGELSAGAGPLIRTEDHSLAEATPSFLVAVEDDVHYRFHP